MGIRYLLTWLKENFGSCFRALPAATEDKSCAAIYIDFNAVLYQCVAHEQSRRQQGLVEINHRAGREAVIAAFEAQVLGAVISALDATITHVLGPLPRTATSGPTDPCTAKRVFIAADGVSPHGKTAQQRNRRASRSSNRLVVLGNGIDWDMSAITPGTALMYRVSAMLEWYALSRVRHWCDVVITVSDAAVPGEGEHKIFEAMRLATAAPLAGAVCICSNDTDVVLGAAQFTDDARYQTHGLKILRCDVSDIETIRADNAIFDIQMFRNALCDKHHWADWKLKVLDNDTWGPPTTLGFADAFRDLLFAFLLFGNDFVPRLASIEISGGSLDDILDFLRANFTSRNRHIVHPTTLKVDLSAAQYLLSEIIRVAQTHQVMIEEAISAAAAKRNRSEGLSITLATGAASDEWLATAKAPRQWSAREQEQAARYWDGLQWTVQYYCGTCPSWRWAYPYEASPSEEALCQCPSPMALQWSAPTKPLTQMLLVLTGEPRQRLLPKPVAALLAPNVDIATIKNPTVVAVRAELEKNLHDQNIEVLEALTNAVVKSLTPLELARLRTGAVYTAMWKLEQLENDVSHVAHQEAAVDVEPSLADDIAKRFFDSCSATRGLPGIDDSDSLDLVAALSSRLAKDGVSFAQATLLGTSKALLWGEPTQEATFDGVGCFLTLAGLRGDRIDRLVVADAGLRAAGLAADVVNTVVSCGDGRKATVVLEAA